MTAITRLPDTLAAARAGMLAELIAPASGGDLNPLEAVAATRRVADNALVTGPIGNAALPEGQTPKPVAQSAPLAELSTTARVITALLAQAGGEAAPVQGSTPLWTGTRSPAVPQLAATLAQTVAVSGLFYESHLSELALAVRSVADLRLEPQAQLPTGAPLPRAPASTAAAAATSPDAIPPLAAPVVHPQAAALVNQQLDLLATQVFRWQGEAWPGVPMTWSVQPDDDSHRPTKAPDQEQPEERRWSTQLSLALPSVGTIDVQLALKGQSVHATLHVHEATSIAHCRAGVDALQHRLAAAGFEVRMLQVEPAGPRPMTGPLP